MNYKVFFIFNFIFISLFISAETNLSENYSINDDSLIYNIGRIDGKYVTENKECSAMISIDTFNVILNYEDKGAGKIEIYVKDFLLDSFSTYSEKIESFINEFKIAYSEYTNDMPNWIWEEEYSTKVLYNDNNILSFQFFVFGYTGGAHPYSYMDFLNFDIVTGDKIELDDIFIDSYKNKLDSIGEILFREHYGISTDESLLEYGYEFDNNKFTLNKNFSINENGLYFYYNQYEIACYAAGTSEVEIPYIYLKDLLKSDSPLNKLLNN